MRFKSWLEADMGDQLHSAKGIWMLPFRDVQKDNIEGYYFDWGKHPNGGSISDLSKVSVGDKVADYALNWTPYWKISGVDEKKQWIYLDPIEPNPLLTGVGAGGKTIDQGDIDVLTGKYETDRVNDILAQWKSGKAHDIRDIAYLLLGTVPLNFGPNGAQGGWYNSRDLYSNRGGQKGMSAEEIQKRDAFVIKMQFKFDVPGKALRGELEPGVWNDFVNGQVQDEHMDDTKLDSEDFSVSGISKSILQHREPAIKLRNAELLMDAYYNYRKYRKDQQKVYSKHDEYEQMKPELDELEKKWKDGGYQDSSILNVIKEVGLKLSKIFITSNDYHDPYWHAKEKFIVFAKQKGWMDVLSAYEKTLDRDNRNRIFDAYNEMGNVKKMWEMFKRETSCENLGKFLHMLARKDRQAVLQYVHDHREELDEKIEAAKDKRWHEKSIREFLGDIEYWKI